jgi:hypothetical protein
MANMTIMKRTTPVSVTGNQLIALIIASLMAVISHRGDFVVAGQAKPAPTAEAPSRLSIASRHSAG